MATKTIEASPLARMDIDALIDAMIEAGRAGDLEAVKKLPGAGVHGQVVYVASRFREVAEQRLAGLSVEDRVALAKALAVYEDSVGGVGSVTALQHVMRHFGGSIDSGYATFAWISRNTRSLWYYDGQSVDFIEPAKAASRRDAARADNETRNFERAALARLRRGERATQLLYNSVRRGDVKAVKALLERGASPSALTPTGESLIGFAKAAGRDEIAALLAVARDERDTP